MQIESTNTCGEGEDEQTFCVQTGYSNRKSCDRCRLVLVCATLMFFLFWMITIYMNVDDGDDFVATAIIVHHSSRICTIRAIRLGGNRKRCLKASIRARSIWLWTWVSNEFVVNIILFIKSWKLKFKIYMNSGKSFDITYIRVVFYSPRPESFAIYKRSTPNGPWTPYQYYRFVVTTRKINRSPNIKLLHQNSICWPNGTVLLKTIASNHNSNKFP